jgi:NAD(P)H-hydrate epimerase
MAKAGTGDVLTGIIGALVAQGLEMRDSAALGALLHALAGEIASEKETPYCVVATDLIGFLPEAIQFLKKGTKK